MTSKRLPDNRSGPLHRLASADFSSAESILQAAVLLLPPEDQTQRKAFESLMPHLYVLRNKGCSWAQLTQLLADAGFVYQLSTVRNYYSEMLATRQDICQQRMNEHILLMAEVRKKTRGVDVAALSERVSAMMEKQRAQVASKLDAVFGHVAGLASPDMAPASPPLRSTLTPPVALAPLAVAPGVENKEAGLGPVPKSQNKPAQTRADNAMPIAPVFKPVVQPVAASRNAAALSENLKFRCAALPEGVIPLGRREGLPEAFYLPGEMEHTAVPGVMLSLEQRLSSVPLEFINTENGDIRIETADEKRFRVLWRKTFPMSKSMTDHHFTSIDESLFKPR